MANGKYNYYVSRPCAGGLNVGLMGVPEAHAAASAQAKQRVAQLQQMQQYQQMQKIQQM